MIGLVIFCGAVSIYFAINPIRIGARVDDMAFMNCPRASIPVVLSDGTVSVTNGLRET